MKTLVVYYSYSGNTKKIANEIKEKIGADIFELEPKEAYSTDYDRVVEEENVDEYIRREIKQKPDISKYDRIIVLTPTWWYHMTPIIYTFLSETDFSNKEVVPVMTNAGWPGTVIKDMTTFAKKNHAKIIYPLEIKFESHVHEISKNEQEKLNNWIEKLK